MGYCTNECRGFGGVQEKAIHAGGSWSLGLEPRQLQGQKRSREALSASSSLIPLFGRSICLSFIAIT